ncbi:MAG: MFS transporter [Chloroflexota bacterium]
MLRARSLRQTFGFMRGNIRILTVNQVLGQFGRALAFPYASLYILSLGGTPAQIGLITALMPLAGLLVFPIAGYLTDRAGRVKLIGLTGLVSGALYVVYALAPDWRWLAVMAILQGLMVVQFPPSSALIADSPAPQDRGRGIATMNMLSSGPALLAPYVAGTLLDRAGVAVGMRTLYGALAAVYLLGAAINLRYLHETAPGDTAPIGLPDIPAVLRSAYGGLPRLLRGLSAPLRALTLVVLLGFLANALAVPFWVVYAVEHKGLSQGEWGLILLVETAILTILGLPAGLLVDRVGRRRCMLAGLALALVTMPLFVWVQGFAPLLAVRASLAVSAALFTPACSALMADLTPRATRGQLMAALGRGSVMLGAASGGTGGPGMGFVLTVPIMIASLSSGFLYAAEPALPWYASSLAVLLALALTLLFIRDPHAAEA